MENDYYVLKPNWNLLSKYKSEIYGLTILWIVIFHSTEMSNVSRVARFPLFSGLIKTGKCGVDVFLFLAGVFSYFSLKNNKKGIKSYYTKRLCRLMIPVIIVDWTYWIIRGFVYKESFSLFLMRISFLSFWTGKDTQVWYIAWIIVMYFFAPYINRIVDKGRFSFIKITAIIVAWYICCFLMKDFGSKGIQDFYYQLEIAFTRGPVFIAGCYVGKNVFENKNINKVILFFTLIGSLYALSQFQNGIIPVTKTCRIPFFIAGCCLPIWCAVLFEIIDIRNWKIIDRILVYAGNLSLEIYLIHIVLRRIFITTPLYVNLSGYGIRNLFLYIILVGIGSLVTAYPVSKLSNWVYSRVQVKR